MDLETLFQMKPVFARFKSAAGPRDYFKVTVSVLDNFKPKLQLALHFFHIAMSPIGVLKQNKEK
jgi:hypothetical protein